MSEFKQARQFEEELIKTAKAIGARGKGILAADESTGTIGKRLAAINLENTEENRRAYRSFLFRSQGIENYISGVILFEETLFQKTADDAKVVDALTKAGVLLGIKVDKGARKLPFTNGDLYTQGLTDLDERCKKYKAAGCSFAKWRAVLKIQNGGISEASMNETAHTLARYAAICQDNGLAPIVEPEILMDGAHSLETCQYWTEKTLSAVYRALQQQNVLLEGTLLKPNMVLAGSDNTEKRSFDANAKATVTALRRTVPSAVPTICFLSGGQSEEEASLNLNAINKYCNEQNTADPRFTTPWSLTFSYGRALQKSTLDAWKGDASKIGEAQEAFLARAKANSEAQLGSYAGGAAGSQESLFHKGYTY